MRSHRPFRASVHTLESRDVPSSGIFDGYLTQLIGDGLAQGVMTIIMDITTPKDNSGTSGIPANPPGTGTIPVQATDLPPGGIKSGPGEMFK